MRRFYLVITLLVLGCGGGAATNGGPTGPTSSTGSVMGTSKPSLYLGTAESSIVFEIDAMAGNTPNVAALDDLKQRLLALPIHKTSVSFVTDETLTGMGDTHAYTVAELNTIADAHQNKAAASGSVGAYLLYADGHDAEDTASQQVLGFAYARDRIVIFAQTIKNVCKQGLPLTQAKVCELEEASVLVHEFGHLLGLVNNGTAMVTPHQDTAHGAHDTNDKCIMYWTVNTTTYNQAIVDSITNGSSSIAEFDANCLADLKRPASR